MNKITEKWARTAPAGPELDRVCAEWMDAIGHYAAISDDGGQTIRGSVSRSGPWRTEYDLKEYLKKQRRYDAFKDAEIVQVPYWEKYSTTWSAAGPLLEAMKMGLEEHGGEWSCGDVSGHILHYGDIIAPTPCLAIARACAVLVARGIERGTWSD